MMILDVPAEGDALEGVRAKIAQAPSFFESAPIVLDLDDVSDDANLDLGKLAARLRELNLVAVGVQNGSEAQNTAALQAGLCPFPSWRSGRQRPGRATSADPEGRDARREPKRERGEESGDSGADDNGRPAELVTTPVRSGRRIHARGDLVAMAPVSVGAELIADGHIHVYGPLRGRALAGVRGDHGARIFCQSLEAELVSIAGAYLVRDDIDESLIGQPVQIYLNGERVEVEPLPRSVRGS
ncbi:septum site-determining protein MinC [Limimonas halophila]|uniref:Probable septum site-determining protein MinC n=2 Tax=Limimonas halophila TaxID=1082479 RepID=A0A1G7NX24_9PROT|nr:septum site-determining protein MinC [Limimonas halophila]